MAKLLSRCPVCESGLSVSELSCPHCRTQIRSDFDSCRFCQIAPEHLAFVEAFLRCEGNISRVEKELGISYPTVRNRLSAALSALGLSGEAAEGNERGTEGNRREDAPTLAPSPPDAQPPIPSSDAATRRKAILDALGRGEMSAEEAANALRELS